MQSEQGFPEVADEDFVTITNNQEGHPVQFHHIIQKTFCDHDGGVWVS